MIADTALPIPVIGKTQNAEEWLSASLRFDVFCAYLFLVLDFFKLSIYYLAFNRFFAPAM
jgi:hypothetical protein